MIHSSVEKEGELCPAEGDDEGEPDVKRRKGEASIDQPSEDIEEDGEEARMVQEFVENST